MNEPAYCMTPGLIRQLTAFYGSAEAGIAAYKAAHDEVTTFNAQEPRPAYPMNLIVRASGEVRTGRSLGL